jgi:dihydroorotate dehydrogenase electron transfer subunit
MVPHAMQAIAPVVEQVTLARDTYRLRIAAPEIAARVTPGQFVMIREPGTSQPLLGRPFALYDTYVDAADRPAGIDVVFLVVGKMTGVMQRWRAGDNVELWGPLGNGFPLLDTPRLLMVAGGIGYTPFPAVAREALGLGTYGKRVRPAGLKHSERVSFRYGVRSAAYLAPLEDFTSLGVDVQVSTDDGSRGHHGFVTHLVKADLSQPADTRPTAVFCCGPEPMMHAVAKLCAAADVPCWLSLETPMACGFGACFSCVTKVRQPGGDWDYRRVCVEGPIFDAATLEM